MRNPIVFAVAVFLSCLLPTAAAQVVDSYGLTFAMTSSRINKTETIPNTFGYLDFGPERSVNPSLGAFVRFNVLKPIILSTEFAYVHKGGRKTMTIQVTSVDDPNGYSTEYTFDIGLHYLELWLNLEPEFSIGEAQMFGILGLSMGKLIQSTSLPKSDLKNNTIGYNVGLGFHLGEALQIPLSVQAKYERDFTQAYATVHGEFKNELYFLGIAVSL